MFALTSNRAQMNKPSHRHRAGSHTRHVIDFFGGHSVRTPSPTWRTGIFRLLCWVLWVGGAVAIQPAMADELTCGPLKSSFGPFDYRTASVADRELVESYHFTPDVEALRRGSTGTIGADLAYTLAVFPNHIRALIAMMNLQFKTKSDKPVGARWSVPCYFDRAIRFQPEDGSVRAVFGVYLFRLGKPDLAVKELEAALTLGADTGNVHYNLGLVYFDLRDYDKSVEHAQRAYAMGFNLPGLKDKLSKAGKWPLSK
jgi:hypothetical protein